MSKFQKNQSGNPGGRPRRRYRVVVAGVEVEQTEAEIFATRLEKALSRVDKILDNDSASTDAHLKAATQVFDRVFGKPRQAVELTGEDGGPIETSNLPPDLSRLSTEELRQLESIHAKVAGAGQPTTY